MKTRYVTPCVLVSLLCLAGLAQTSTGQDVLARITVESGKYSRIDTPVSVSLSGVKGITQGSDVNLVR